MHTNTTGGSSDRPVMHLRPKSEIPEKFKGMSKDQIDYELGYLSDDEREKISDLMIEQK